MTFSKPLSRYRVSFPHTFNNVELVGAFLFPYPHTRLKLLSRAPIAGLARVAFWPPSGRRKGYSCRGSTEMGQVLWGPQRMTVCWSRRPTEKRGGEDVRVRWRRDSCVECPAR